VLEERKDEEINKIKMKSPPPSTPIALPPCDFSSKPQKNYHLLLLFLVVSIFR